MGKENTMSKVKPAPGRLTLEGLLHHDYISQVVYDAILEDRAEHLAYQKRRMLDLIGEDEEPQFTDPYTLWGDTSYRHVDVVYGHNDLREDLRRRVEKL